MLALLTTLLSWPALAATPLVVLYGDFKTTAMQIERMDSEQLRGRTAGGEAVAISIADFIAADRDTTPIASGDKLMLNVAGDTRIAGEAVALEGETFVWKSPLLGKVAVPLASVRGISRGGGLARLPADKEDVVRLVNGDTVRGALASVEPQQLTLQTQSGALSVPWSSVAEMRLAETSATVAVPKMEFRVELSDGSVWGATQVSANAEKLMLTPTGGGAAELPLAELRSLEREGGRVMWLARQSPLRAQYTPYLTHSAPQPAITTGPTRVADQVFRTSLRVRPQSRVAYAVPADATRFRTSYAQEKESPLADVTIRIIADGKVLLEKANVTSASPAGPVDIPIAGTKELLLEVDYGANYDVADSLLWLDAAFVR